MPSVSFAITTHCEHRELDNLLSLLCNKINKEQDEIVILCDKDKTTQEVRDVIAKYFHEFNDVNISIHEFPLNNDFASFKNHLNSCCKHGDYIFQLDADEFPDSNLIYNLHAILEANPTVDVFRVPRINIVSGITEKFIKKWHWRVSHVDNRINFPDFQWRLYRNVSSICWKNKVHEVLAGFNTITDLPAEDEFCLVHIKSLPKQISQNAYYDTIH